MDTNNEKACTGLLLTKLVTHKKQLLTDSTSSIVAFHFYSSSILFILFSILVLPKTYPSIFVYSNMGFHNQN